MIEQKNKEISLNKTKAKIIWRMRTNNNKNKTLRN